MQLKDKICIVTGGASGLGYKIVQMLLNEGSKVVILDINEKLLEELPKRDDLLKIKCDITDEGQISSAIALAEETFSKIDILVNNAGILHSEPLLNIMGIEKKHSFLNWKKVIDTNLTATFLVTSYVAEKMLFKRIKGVVINISSVCATGNAGQTAYSAAKAGVESMTKVWSKELGPLGIRSIAIAPGFMNTESTYGAVSEKMLDDLKRLTPLRRLGHADEISHAVKFAIENDFINGVVIEVNGGLVV